MCAQQKCYNFRSGTFCRAALGGDGWLGKRSMQINNNWIKTGALVAALAVVLGAFDIQEIASHYTGGASQDSVETLNPGSYMEIGKAILFHFVHALAIVLVGVLLVLRPGRLLRLSGQSFLLGIVMFSGSIYAVSLTGIEWIQHFKVLGVVLLLIGWILLVEGACPGWNTKSESGTGETKDV